MILLTEILHNVFTYLSYIDLINVKLINKNFCRIVKEYKYNTSKKYIKKLSNRNIYNEIIEEILKELYLKKFKIHEYNLIITNLRTGSLITTSE